MANSNDFILQGPPLPFTLSESLGSLLIRRLKEANTKIYQTLSPSNESDTFRDVLERSISVAIEMQRRGIGKGDIVSVCTYNHPDTCIPLLASLYIGAVMSPIHPTLVLSEFKHFFSLSKPKLIFCEPNSSNILNTAFTELNQEVEIVEFFGNGESGFTPFSDLLEHTDSESVNNFVPLNFNNPYEHLAVILCSSGTTGTPKMIEISHGGLIHAIHQIGDPPMDGLCFLNLSYIIWISDIKMIIFGIIKHVQRIVINDFHSDLIMETLEKYKVYLFITGVSQLVQIVKHKHSRKYDVSKLALLCTSGSKVSSELIADAKNIFPRTILSSSYGTSEAVAMAFYATGDKPELSIGKVTPGTQAKIMDVEMNKPLGPNQKGELCLKSKAIMMGYYNNPKATADAIDKDGWLHTGDMCYYDDNKFFYFDSRISDIFKSLGFYIRPQEIEDVLKTHPEIYEAAVIGEAHIEEQARAKAFIITKPDSQLKVSDVHEYIKKHMSPKHELRGGVVFVDDLPLTSTGKINKKQLLKLNAKTV